MTTKNTGGPAFPLGNTPEEWMNGMNLRDYFAAKAMQAWATKFDVSSDPECTDTKQLACIAYAIADAMLAERGRSE